MKVIVFLCLVAIVSCGLDCTQIPDPKGSGRIFDLTALIGKELLLTDSFSTYKTTICKNTYETCGQCGGPAGYCQSTEFWEDCIGVFTTAIGMQSPTGVELLYDNGDWGSVGRVKLICDPNAGESDNLHGEGNLKTMVAHSKHACLTDGVNGAISLGTIIIISLCVIVIVYLVAGVLYNRFMKDQSGVEMLPHLEFWQSVPLLVKDGAVYTLVSVQRLTGRE